MGAWGRSGFGIAIFLVCAWAAQASAAPSIPTIEPSSEELKTAEFEQQPNRVFEQKLRAPPIVVDGQHLHPKYQYYLEQRAAGGSGASAEAKRAAQAESLRNPEAAARSRAATDRSWTFRTKVTKPMAKVEDRTLPGSAVPVPVRIYTPQATQRDPLPVLVYLHGGGWLFGSVAAADRAVRLIANEAEVIVVSVDYRMAPDHKFPAANDDVFAAFDWVSRNAATIGGDPRRIGIGGDSVGGLMSLVVAQRLRGTQQLPAALLLYYPAVDLSTRQYPSYQLFRVGYGLDVPFMDMMVDLAFTDPKQRDHIDASPINAASFTGAPPAIIATAGFDPIRDHGKVLAQRLVADGVDVQYTNYASLIHGFMQFSGTIDDAEAACEETARQFGALIRRARYQPGVH
jgi:acetyl esterase